MSLEDRTLDILRQHMLRQEKVAALETLWNGSDEESLYLSSKIDLMMTRNSVSFFSHNPMMCKHTCDLLLSDVDIEL
jgi:hypothetical protein